MKTQTRITDDDGTVITYDNQFMTESAASPRRVIWAPFTARAWGELGYAIISLALTLVALVIIIPTLANGPLWALSATAVRRFGAAARALARALIGEDIPEPPPFGPVYRVKVATPDSVRLYEAVGKAGGKARIWESRPGVTITKLPEARVKALAAEAGITVTWLHTQGELGNWAGARIADPVAWRTRAYFGLKLPLAVIGLAAVALGYLGGLLCLTFPVWWSLGPWAGSRHLGGAFSTLPGSFIPLPLGGALLIAAPWAAHVLTDADRWLMRSLIGPGAATMRIHALEQSRAQVVDDSAARLRTIERDLHDGTQAQLVALAMKLGLAREKLADGGIDLARVTQLVEDAHRGALEAIADLRTVARGIHPPVLDNGLADALATLANRSAVPVELVTDIPERPSAAIETIAYFSAAELLTNVARHSGARHATLEAVHVPGLLRIRVTDDGAGGARPVDGGGLRGLAERVRTGDGRIEVSSPQGGPTAVTVELPSRA